MNSAPQPLALEDVPLQFHSLHARLEDLIADQKAREEEERIRLAIVHLLTRHEGILHVKSTGKTMRDESYPLGHMKPEDFERLPMDERFRLAKIVKHEDYQDIGEMKWKLAQSVEGKHRNGSKSHPKPYSGRRGFKRRPR